MLSKVVELVISRSHANSRSPPVAMLKSKVFSPCLNMLSVMEPLTDASFTRHAVTLTTLTPELSFPTNTLPLNVPALLFSVENTISLMLKATGLLL